MLSLRADSEDGLSTSAIMLPPAVELSDAGESFMESLSVSCDALATSSSAMAGMRFESYYSLAACTHVLASIYAYVTGNNVSIPLQASSKNFYPLILPAMDTDFNFLVHACTTRG